MKIALASLQQESNTLSPLYSYKHDFDQVYGEKMLERIHVAEMLHKENVTIVPTMYAHALPGGTLIKEDFLSLVDEIINNIPVDVDGIWLYLHGALYVEEICSGETYLLRQVRNKVGYRVPISICLDFHANNTDEICDLANIITGFQTAPHTDQIQTEQRAMKLLLHCMKNGLLPKPQLARVNVIVPIDCILTDKPPLNIIMAKAEEIEQLTGMLSVQVFSGQSWVDAPYTGPSMVVTHEYDNELALQYARELSAMYYDARYDFKFLIEALDPDKAIIAAVSAKENPVFISDSGDNTTAGATGDNAFLLGKLLENKFEGVLLAGITDSDACDKCYSAEIGDEIVMSVGGTLSKYSEKVIVNGILKFRGDILGYTGDNAGPAAIINSHGIDIVITKNRTAFTTLKIFESICIDIFKYKIVVVKLGYLFPELAEIAKKTILAFTPGSSVEHLEDMDMKNIRRPMYPLDDNFM